jgi:uncharacterized protein YyaL (SSP411 family)
VLAGPERAGRYRGVAEAALTTAGTLLARHARFAGGWATAAEAALRGPLQVAVVGADEAAREPLATAARRVAPGGSVVVAGDPEAPGVPLLADRPLVGGSAAAYVCRGYVCERPTTSPEDLADALRAV